MQGIEDREAIRMATVGPPSHWTINMQHFQVKLFDPVNVNTDCHIALKEKRSMLTK